VTPIVLLLNDTNIKFNMITIYYFLYLSSYIHKEGWNSEDLFKN
jgi:hypothetical protein